MIVKISNSAFGKGRTYINTVVKVESNNFLFIHSRENMKKFRRLLAVLFSLTLVINCVTDYVTLSF